jgi:hypothetical protein
MEGSTVSLILNVTSNPEHRALWEHLATLHGQQEAENDYADARRYLDFQHFDLEGWIAREATEETERALAGITVEDPAAASAIYRAAFSAAYRARVQHLDQREA